GASYALGVATPPFNLDDNAAHAATIDYTAGTLSLSLDGAGTPLLTVSVNLATTLNLAAGGLAWVGFTGATCVGYENQDILSWQFSQGGGSDTTTLTVNNVPPTIPVDVDLTPNTIAENAIKGTAVGITAHSTDVDADTITYSLVNSAGGR